jgi:hypothetical protein
MLRPTIGHLRLVSADLSFIGPTLLTAGRNKEDSVRFTQGTGKKGGVSVLLDPVRAGGKRNPGACGGVLGGMSRRNPQQASRICHQLVITVSDVSHTWILRNCRSMEAFMKSITNRSPPERTLPIPSHTFGCREEGWRVSTTQLNDEKRRKVRCQESNPK